MAFKFWGKALLASCPLWLVACGNVATQDQAGSSPPAGKTLARPAPLPPAEVVRRFYQWYLKDVYLKEPSAGAEGPQVVVAKNGRYQLDATRHQAFLRKAGYFSSRFYANEGRAFETCNQQLRKVSAKQAEAAGSSAIDFVHGNACDFLRWMVWTGGQGESLNTVKIKKTTLLPDSAVVVAAIGDSASGAAYEYSHPSVTLVLEKGGWKISRITISFPPQE